LKKNIIIIIRFDFDVNSMRQSIRSSLSVLFTALSILFSEFIQSTSGIPTEFQAASLAKQLLGRQKVGDMMVRFSPEQVGTETEYIDYPFGQVELYAQDCNTSKDIIIYASPLEQTIDSVMNYRNNVTFHVRDYNADYINDPLEKKRVTFMGYADLGPDKDDPEYEEFADCFFAKHPDARAWQNMKYHEFHFWRIIPKKIHYVGGFGDTHYIGWISEENWINAPASSSCLDWSFGGCPVVDRPCCPYDLDNAMAPCCAEATVES